ncbi:methyl-accepting chemotaxis protein [Paenibacillus psychroresistens]|nr:HAMP domain-containing methyl-accepting chemotaxis protein [Paenibacillus psychroresistens]
MLKNRSIVVKILLGFFIVILLFSSAAVLNYNKLKDVKAALNENDMREQDQKAALEIKNYVGILYSNQADVIINQSEESITNYKEYAVKFKQLIEDVSKSVDKQSQIDWVKTLKTASEGYIKSFDNVVEIFNKRSTLSAEQLSEQYKVLDDQTDAFKATIYTTSDQLIQSFSSEYKASNANSIAQIAKVNSQLVITCIIDIILAFALALFLSRVITRPVIRLMNHAQSIAKGDLTQNIKSNSRDEIGRLTENFAQMQRNLQVLVKEVNANSQDVSASSELLSASSQETAAASNEISISIFEVAKGAEAQGIASQESARAMEEMSIGIQRIAETSATVTEVSLEATEKAIHGNKLLQQVVSQMDSIAQKVERSAIMVQQLEKQSIEIGSIVSVISGIATQTNLLALNAAIEAARAGENGRGFAVVAGEVRKLAEQSGSSANQISELIEQIQIDTKLAVGAMSEGTREVAAGSQIVHEAGDSFHLILQAIEQVADQIRDVSSVAEQMSAGSEEITASVIESASIAKLTSNAAQIVVDNTTQQLAALQEVAASANDLSQMSQKLQAAISRFKV